MVDQVDFSLLFLNFYFIYWSRIVWGFPGGSVLKISPASAGVTGLIPGLGRSPGEGNGNLVQYSCLGNPRQAIKIVSDMELVLGKFKEMNEWDMEGQASFIVKGHLGALRVIGIDASEFDRGGFEG